MTDDIVEAVSRRKAIAVTRCGERLPITHWFDDDGDECSPDNAISCVAEYGDKFVAINLREFETLSGH